MPQTAHLQPILQATAKLTSRSYGKSRLWYGIYHGLEGTPGPCCSLLGENGLQSSGWAAKLTPKERGTTAELTMCSHSLGSWVPNDCSPVLQQIPEIQWYWNINTEKTPELASLKFFPSVCLRVTAAHGAALLLLGKNTSVHFTQHLSRVC